MLESNVARVLQKINERPNALVLDVGGWASPFNRANWVLDAEPYETRGFYGTIGLPPSQGGDVEHFSKATWVVRDICDRRPWPFQDKHFDYAICSHTLEDIRDPLFVCSELVRVARAGYIEVPSREAEQSRGWESPRFAGLGHHRWLVEIQGDHIDFTMKYHNVHDRYKLAFPQTYLWGLSPEQRVSFLFWANDFQYREIILHGVDTITSNLASFVSARYRYGPYHEWLQGCSDIARSMIKLAQRGARVPRKVLGRLARTSRPGAPADVVRPADLSMETKCP